MDRCRWFHRLGSELTAAVLVSLLSGVLLFAGLQKVSNYVLSQWTGTYKYYEKQQENSIHRLQTFLDKYQIKLRNVEEVNRWVKQEEYVSVLIFQGQKMIYSSYPTRPEEETMISDGSLGGETAIDDVSGTESTNDLYTVHFADGTASVFLFSYHELLYYRLTAAVEGVLSFLLFISLFLWFIRKKTSYIELLKDDLQILEGGNLDYVVNVRGSDELAELAEGIDRMRRSIIVRDEEEKRMRKANQDLVTAMSHDLRTPLTSLLGYLELLDDGGYEEEQQKRFIRNSRQKATQIKEMSDCLFEYFLVYGKSSEEISIEEADAMALVQQTVCEEAYALEGKNFTVTMEMEEVTCPLMVNTDLFRRLIDNLFSNLVKYADPSAPVTITYRKAAGGISLTFCNKKNQAVGMVESSGIGLKTCWKIMREHGGRFDIREDDESFQVILFFPEIAV